MQLFKASPSDILQRLPSNREIEIYLRLNNGNGCCVLVDPSHQLKDLFAIHIIKQLGIIHPFTATSKNQ